LSDEDSLFETIIVTANDKLVKLFLNNKIKFTDISNMLLKICDIAEFKKFKSIKPRNIEEIHNLSDYVSLKIDTITIYTRNVKIFFSLYFINYFFSLFSLFKKL
jgi:1-deoxy-D-xylulose-5-phosphate reductoisomerase